jgi:hypothetical protein
MEMVHTYTLTGKDMRADGLKIRNTGTEPTNIRMEINTTENGRMTIVTATERCNIAITLPTKDNGRKGSSTAEGSSPSSKEIAITENG